MSVKIEKEIEKITQKIENEPDNAEYYFSRGCAYGWLGNRQKCHDDYAKAVELEPDNMIYLTNFAILAKEIQVHFGQALLPFVESSGSYVENFKNLRKNLKNVINGSAAHIPPIQVMDSRHIKPYEIVLYVDKKLVFKKEFLAEEVNNDNIFNDIFEIIKKLFSREYLKTA